MSSETFKTIAKAIAGTGVVTNVYDILNIAEAVQAALPDALIDVTTAEGRVQFALNHAPTLAEMRNGKKINAIKEFRTATGCGLLDAKNAVEDIRVLDATGYRSPYTY